MCLITDNKEPKVAQEDILCYKVLVANREGGLFSPYFPAKWKVGQKKTVNSIEPKLGVNNPSYSINEGLHSYKRWGSAYKVASFMNFNRRGGPFVVAQARIPKGAKYWESTCHDEYVSDALIITCGAV